MLKQLLPFLIALLFFSTAHSQVKNVTFYFKTGIQFRNTDKFTEALDAFNKAISLNKYFDSAYVEMGNIFLKIGNTDNAITAYKIAISINSKYTEALIAMGKLYRDTKQNFDSSIFYYTKAVAIDTRNKDIWYGLAWVYNAKKEYDNAINFAAKALEVDNTYKPAYNELGHAYRGSQKFTEGIEQFKKNLAVSEVDLAYLYSGFCYTELKDKASAMEMHEKLNKINEKMANALKKKIDAMQ